VGRNNLYAIESHLHELMLQSEHRTLDAEEADFFYVPTYLACFMWPIQVGGGAGNAGTELHCSASCDLAQQLRLR
jgi:hypothetical protein